MKEKFYSFIKNLQDKITKEFELTDGNELFTEDVWQRKEGGGGRTRILQNGGVFTTYLKITLVNFQYKPMLMH